VLALALKLTMSPWQLRSLEAVRSVLALTTLCVAVRESAKGR